MNAKETRAPNYRRLIIIAVVLIIFSTLMVFYARDVIRELVVLPLSYLFWVIGILVRMTPQIFFWAVLMLIAFLIAYRNLAARKKVVASVPVLVNDLPPDTTNGRALFWAVKVRLYNASRGGYYQNTFHTAITRLLLDILSYRYRLPTRVVEERIKEGTIDVPPEVRAYLQSHLGSFETVYGGFFAELWRSLLEKARSAWARLTANPDQTAQPPLDPQLEFILNYMKEELEVSHDESGR